MLLPDNMQPTLSIYYAGYVVLKELQVNPRQNILELYQNIKNDSNMSFPTFILSIDWLYLIDTIKMDRNGDIEYVYKKISDNK